MQLEDLYKETLVKHYKARHGYGVLEAYTQSAFRTNHACGDEIRVFVDTSDAVIRQLSYELSGCTMCQSSASIMYDLCVRQTISHALFLRDAVKKMLVDKQCSQREILKDAAAFETVSNFPGRIRCVCLCWDALAEAVNADDARSTKND